MLKNHLTPLYVSKKILSPEVWEKKFLPKPNHPSPNKRQMVSGLLKLSFVSF